MQCHLTSVGMTIIFVILTWDHISPQFEQNEFINAVKFLNLEGQKNS
jgi:hypothetical protein